MFSKFLLNKFVCYPDLGLKTVADALELPLFIQISENKSNCSKMNYIPSSGDEVEDLFLLLENVKTQHDIDAICCGALLSDYQRVRVESVCARLDIVNLGRYLIYLELLNIKYWQK